jgi:methylmalonyl-CoA mutase N-terminal domain/subunit
MWAKIMKDRFQAKNEKSWMLRFHTQTGGSTLTAQQPMNNIVRTTVQAMAAVLGGTQSLHTNGMDEALGLPTQEAVQVALRTQQLIASESGITDTIDPLAGSYYMEALTDALEEKAQAYIDRIDQMGGALVAIEEGYIQGEIQQTAYDYQLGVERNENIVVGVNKYKIEEEVKPKILRVDESVRQRQGERLAALRAGRDQPAVDQALARLKEAAQGEANLMPYILIAVEAYATTGEICHALRSVWGEYQPPVTI